MNINKSYPCHPTNYRKRRDSIKYIVIHYVGATGSALANVKYYGGTPNIGASAHYYVGHASENGAVYQSVAPEDCAWHCGGTKYYHSECRNDNAIGIEMCCHKRTDGTWYFDNITVEKTIELTRWLMNEYGIAPENVIRHYDVTHKTCPAPFVNDADMWMRFKSALVKIEEYTDVNDIVRELGYRGIVGDTAGMAAEMKVEPNGRLYWLGRKILHYIRTHESAVRQSTDEYEDVHDIVWDLGYRSIVTDTAGMEEEMRSEPDGRLYWLARKGLQYIRLRD